MRLLCLSLYTLANAYDLQAPSIMVQLFSQQSNIVSMAEVLSKRYDDRRIEKLAQVSLQAGDTSATSSQIMAETESRASLRAIARDRTSFTDALAECLLGTFLVLLGLAFVYKNEQRQMRVERLLKQASQRVTEIRDIYHPKQTNNRELVYVSSISKNDYGLQDSTLGIQTENSAKLTRKVEMY